jgi:hypothetical protein
MAGAKPWNLTGFSKRHFGVYPKSKAILFSQETVLHTPVFAARRHDFEVKPKPISQLLRLFSGFSGLTFEVC